MKRNRILIALALLMSCLVVVAQESTIPPSLRGGIKVDAKTIQTALAMQEQGWEYNMPSPKSPQAAWGNYDGRTTWYVGYWENSKTGETSTPIQSRRMGSLLVTAPGAQAGGAAAALRRLLNFNGSYQRVVALHREDERRAIPCFVRPP